MFQTLQWLPFSLRVKSKSLNDLQSPSQSGPLRLWPSHLLTSLSSSLTLPQLYWPLCWPSHRPEIILSQSLSTSEYSCLLLTEHSSPDICMSLSHLLQHVLYQQILKDLFLTLLFQPNLLLSLSYFSALFSSIVFLVIKWPTIIDLFSAYLPSTRMYAPWEQAFCPLLSPYHQEQRLAYRWHSIWIDKLLL